MDWIDLAQDWDKWWAFVRTAGYEGKNWTILGYYVASSGNFLPTFQYNLPVPSQVVPKRWYEITTTCCVITQNSAILG